jgi:hypothetical protein
MQGNERQGILVGRRDELAQLGPILRGRQSGPRLVYLHGPGGVGKTTLVNAWLKRARAARLSVAYVDGRRCEPTPQSLLSAISSALGLRTRTSPLPKLKKSRRRHLIVIDAYEAVAPLDDWVRERLLSQLPDEAILALSGRKPPSTTWKSLAASKQICFFPVRNLDARESRALLRARKVPAAQHDEILAFTHGHPLALALVAEVSAQRHSATFEPDVDVVRTLLQQFVGNVEDPAKRAALEACSLPRATKEPLLAKMLGISDEEAHPLFEWLAERSFMQAGRDGLLLHDIVREVIISELRWRNRDRYAQLIRRCHDYYRERLDHAASWEMARDWFHLLHFHDPLLKSIQSYIVDTAPVTSFFVDTARPSDIPELLAMVRRHEGDESTAIAEHWLARQPHGLRVVRGGAHTCVGFLEILTLTSSTPPADIEADPGASAIWRYARNHGLSPDETVSVDRLAIAGDTYQSMGPIWVNLSSTGGFEDLAGSHAMFFLVLAQPLPDVVVEYFEFIRIDEAEFEVGGRHYVVYAHDWRQLSRATHIERKLQRALGMAAPAAPTEPPPSVALSLEGFTSAMQRALRDLHRPLSLRMNPLLYSRLVSSRISPEVALEERVAVLRKIVREAVERFRQLPRAHKLVRALEATYLVESPAQEIVAERLGLPFSTYRYQLTRAVSRVVDLLWEAEIGAP